MHSLFQDDLPSVSVSKLRAASVVTPDADRVQITFGEGDERLRRNVRVLHVTFPNGGSWSFFLCPACGRTALILRLNGKPMCRRCLLRDGIRYRIAGGSSAERAAARAKRIEKLDAQLRGGPARLKPRLGRTLDRRGRLEASLQRARIVRRGRFQFHG